MMNKNQQVLRALICQLLGAFVLLVGPGMESALWAQVAETNLASGLTGSTQVVAGAEVQIYSIGVTDPGGFGESNRVGHEGGGGNLGVELTISDMSAPTGLVAADIAELRLYHSTNNVLDTGTDTQLGTQATVNIGAVTEIDATGAGNPARTITFGAEDFIFVTAIISASATGGHAFRVGAAAGSLGMTRDTGPTLDYSRGSVFAAADGNHIVIAAETPSFTSGVAGGGRGIPFGGETVMLALLVGSGLCMIRRTFA